MSSTYPDISSCDSVITPGIHTLILEQLPHDYNILYIIDSLSTSTLSDHDPTSSSGKQSN